MKTSNVLASLLFGSMAIAAPVNKRALVTQTVVVYETVVVVTTVYPDDTVPSTVAPVTTSEPGLFYEKPSKKPASSAAAPTSSAVPAYTPPAYTPPAAPSSSSVYTPPPPPSSSSVYTPPPAPSSSAVYTPPAAPSSVYTPPVVVSSAAPAPSSTPVSGGGGDSASYNGDITIYDNTGAAGACGIPLYDNMEVCAIAHGLWDAQGGSTYDYMTGKATNPYCGKTATIHYNGNTATCVIQDMCPGCEGKDLDLSVATWKKLTGSEERTRYQASWSVTL